MDMEYEREKIPINNWGRVSRFSNQTCLWEVSVAFEYAVRLCAQMKKVDDIGSKIKETFLCSFPISPKQTNKQTKVYQKEKMV